ncbi:MAG: ribulose-phosphate 3-epimerase [Alphaproteobacteria bacterium]|nr:ribulose-phosphate 3-epimerase [Alphaproteobacteria bacterium]MBN2779807.1 ribulose-phosphate 3-epimerase [Alphaproteobacteria bacterium]
MLPIYPSLLAADLSDLSTVLRKVESANPAGVHIDVMDGEFVENTSFDFALTQKIAKSTNLPLDVHFMTKNPEKFMQPYLGLDIARISVHVEESPSLLFLQKLRDKGIKVGIAIDLPTPVEDLLPYIDHVDFIMIMGVKCGASGQKFSFEAIEKTIWARDHFEGEIMLDGGINDYTAPLVEKAGASSIVMGSAFFK